MRDFINENLWVFSLLFILVLVFYSSVFLHPGYILTPSPDMAGHGAWKDILLKTILNERAFPLWNRYEFSGNPYLANPFSGIFYIPYLIFFVIQSDTVFGYLFALNTLLIGIFSYFFARQIMKGKIGPTISAICFMFSGTVIPRIYEGHVAHTNVLAWVCCAFLLVELFIKKQKPIYGVLISITISLMVLGGQLQVTFYSSFLILIYALLRSYINYRSSKKLKENIFIIFKLALFVALGIALCAVQILPTLEFSSLSVRGGGLPFDYASTFSIPLFQLVSFFLPNSFGSPDLNVWWGRGNFWEFSVYLGFLPLILAMLSYYKVNKYVIIFSVLFIFSLIFSLGSYGPLFIHFYNYIPGFNMFRIPATMLLGCVFSLSILAGFGYIQLISIIENKSKKSFYVILTTIIVISLISLFLIYVTRLDQSFINGIYANFLAKLSNSTVEIFNKVLMRDTFLIFAFSTLFATGLIFSRILKSSLFLKIILVTLIVIDLLIFGKRFINTKPPEKSQYPKIESYVVNNIADFKIYDLSGTSFLNLQRKLVPNATGYSPTFLASYRDYAWMIGDHLEMEHEPYISLYNLKNINLLKMLGVKYVISTNELKDNELNLVMEEHENFLYFLKSTKRMGYVISNTKLIADEKEAFKIITQNNFDEKEVLILNDSKAPSMQVPNKFRDVNAKVTTNEVNSQFSAEQNGYFVVREVWYPGWKAYVNGRQVPIYRANYLFRAIPIKKGLNEIYMVYDPIPFKIGLLMSSISLFGISIYFTFKFKNSNSIRKFFK